MIINAEDKKRFFFLFIVISLAVSLPLIYHTLTQLSGLPFLLNLDDGYIHARLAQNLAQTGHSGLNPGETGGGSSSLPWTLLLAGCSLAGIAADKAAWFMSLFTWALTAWAGALLSYKLFGNSVKSWIAAIAIALSGQLAMSALSGMETHLFLFLIIMSIYFHAQQRLWISAYWCAFAAVTRPEALMLAIAFFMVEFIKILKYDNKESSKRILKAGFRFTLTPIAVLISIALLALLSGEMPGTLAARRWLIGMPPTPWENISLSAKGASILINQLIDRVINLVGPGHGIGVIWALVIVFLAVAGSFIHSKPSIKVIALYLFFHFLFFLIFLPITGHHGRYFAPLWALAPLLVVNGWSYLGSRLKNFQFQKLSPYLAAILIAGYVPQIFKWGRFHFDTVDHLTRIHLRMAQTVNSSIPGNETIGVFDIGLMSWTVQNRIIDLGGLTSNHILNRLHNGNVTNVLNENDVEYLVLPEYDGPNRWVLVRRLNINPNDLQMIERFSLGNKVMPHLSATMVALPALGLHKRKPNESGEVQPVR
ncbi:MAG: hypothetical protein P9L92_07505 [Candidatus Electryonea clarkiae]|nr:hypothetical protein [Candidatus Electryonea clarkiae]MDP8289016.1 hypothetical protein [Candidatus Electryonea clarkiae]